MSLSPREVYKREDLPFIEKSLELILSGKYLELGEVSTIIGLEVGEIEDVAAAWPDVDLCEDVPRIAVKGALGNLVGYPHGKSREIEAAMGCSVGYMKELVELLPKSKL